MRIGLARVKSPQALHQRGPMAMGSGQGEALHEASIAELQALLASGELCCVDLVDWHVERIAAHDQRGLALNSIICLNPQAGEAAQQLDARMKEAGPVGPPGKGR